ncbi:UAA transporter [Metschnikowia bicuspidata]|uniref:UDP-galactose transporter homolog 1 n=1 Tax=Metschnikowia bicuspidata TaxID=27322 RepID=A0A4P9ZG83_9ASCO|nr:UAA transporter [Metschnikowia bicuspidata]
MEATPGACTLTLCVLGLYALFLSWSLLQERINTKPYGSPDAPVYFKAPLIINSIQAFFAALVGLVYSRMAHGENPWGVLRAADGAIHGPLLRSFLVIAVSSSVSSPLAYASLRHVDYVAFLLAKSCKLLPVMAVHFVLYRTRFPAYKCAVAGLVTGGVVLFTLAKRGATCSEANSGHLVLGMAPLGALMLLDGFTNSTQDQMFRARGARQSLTGASLMCVLNVLVCALTLAYVVVFRWLLEGMYTVAFVKAHPCVLVDVLVFALLGAVGQVCVFVMLEKFGSMALVTATVTRKMLSMVLSVVFFGHRLAAAQWMGVALVFGGIACEACVKMGREKQKTA